MYIFEPLSIEDENILKLMGGNIVVSGDNEIQEAGLPMFDVVSILINVLSTLLINFTDRW